MIYTNESKDTKSSLEAVKSSKTKPRKAIAEIIVVLISIMPMAIFVFLVLKFPPLRYKVNREQLFGFGAVVIVLGISSGLSKLVRPAIRKIFGLD